MRSHPLSLFAGGGRGFLPWATRRGLPLGQIDLERASLIRHLAICVAVLAAYFFQTELHVGNEVLWIFALAALFNLCIVLLPDRGNMRCMVCFLSPLLGVACWSALMFLTGGVHSPFIAGLGVEIVISALALHPAGTAMVTGTTVAGLWSEETIMGLDASSRPLLLQTGFLAMMGGIVFLLSRHRDQAQAQMAGQMTMLDQRLQALQDELEEARSLGDVGERAAALAHTLKNATQSVSGYAKLTEAQLTPGRRGRRVLEGLQASVRRLETVTREMLRSGSRPGIGAVCRTEGSGIRRTIKEVCAELALLHPHIRWVQHAESAFPAVFCSPIHLREILLVLAQNAAEALGSRGTVTVSAGIHAGRFRIKVQDNGPGLSQEARQHLFQPAYTTKLDGNGFGLYLARRLVESHRGMLTVASSRAEGAVFSAHLCLIDTGDQND